MGALKTIKPTRLVGVDMNLSGAWRALGSFNLDECDIDAVLDAAETLVINQVSGGKTGKLRITDDAQPTKPVLMYWSVDKGWQEARNASR